jgi:hypothetical protein
LLSAAAITATASADITNVKEALDAAMKQETIAAGGEKMKLYSLNANYNGATKRWSFQFYDGGANIHSVSVDKTGKARYYSRDKGTMRVFDDLDWTKLPAPSAVLIDDIIGQSKAALAALKFETVDNGKIYMNYYVRSEYRQKDKAYHAWSVTLPLKAEKQGKTVGFKDGKIDTILTSTLYGG